MADLSSILGSAGIGSAIGKAVVSLELDTKKYVAEMNAAHAQTTASTKSMAAGMSAFGTGGLVALGLVGGASVKLALDFDKAFTRIAAISNTSAGAIEGMKAEVLALAGETAQSPQELADALFFLASAGLKASDVMPALEASAKASAVGLGTTADVANIVASALNAYSESGLTAAQATDVLVAAVREGRAEPEEFANALGRILPIASTVGVTFDQVAASMAALSNIGLDVNEGVTAMRGVLQAIAAPGTQAAEAMDTLGLSAQQLLDAISEDGIIGALRLLDEAAQAQTDTQAGYNDALRKIIPNVRALTGVLGLTVQESGKVDAIFSNVLNSTDSLGKAFATTAESEAFQLQKALNDLVVTGTRFGANVLPGVVNSIQTMIPLVESLFRNMDVLLGVFLAFKAGGAAAAAGMASLGAALGPIALLIGGAVAAGRALNDTFFAADQTVDELASAVSGPLKAALDAGIISTTQYVEAARALRDPTIENAEALLRVQHAIEQQQRREEEELLIRQASENQWKGYQQVLLSGARAAREVGDGAREGAKGVREIGDAAREAMKEFKTDVVDSTRVAIGAFKNMNEAFSITPRELRQHLRTAIDIARQFGRDLREILTDKTLTSEQRRALASLPPEYRRAFAEAGTEGKKELAKQAVELSRLNSRNWKDFATAAKPAAAAGGRETGAAMMAGAVKGITDGAPAVSAAVSNAVREAIAAGRKAAGAQSPSKEMRKLGEDVMIGFQIGLDDRGGKVVDEVHQWMLQMIAVWRGAGMGAKDAFEMALEGLQDVARDAADYVSKRVRLIERGIDDLGSTLDKVKSKASSFRDAIGGAFSGFADIGGAFGQEEFGGSLSAAISAQVNGAQGLAEILQILKRQGASRALLSEVAETGEGFGRALLAGGPTQIRDANEALQTIAELSRQTGKALSEAFFGEKIDRLDGKLDRLHEDLKEQNQLLRRLEHGHDILMDGERVAALIRRDLIRTGDRNGSTGIR
jgi:TP901 family phage tail tape measure protein